MNSTQQRFFQQLAQIQEACVQRALAGPGSLEDRLYHVSYEMAAGILELIDGYSPFSSDRYDLVNTVTGERLKEQPFLELHDHLEEFLR